jgi:hypothetical protein
METFRANPDVEIVRDGDWSDYENVASFRVRDGATLNPDNIRLHYALAFENAFASFLVLRERFGRPDLRFQVGIPAPIDLALYSFGEVVFGDPTILDARTAASVREIEKVHARGGDDVVTRDVRPLVLLANTLAAGWTEGRALEYVHAPFAAAAEPPIPEESFYEPLSELALPAETRFIAGFLHESLDTAAHRELLARIERLTGREVDVAAACGLGRRDTDEEAFEQMRETAALLETPATERGTTGVSRVG